jgi:hypothetical protein
VLPYAHYLFPMSLVGRLAKYKLTLQDYNLHIIHRAGKWNTFCDYLSRYTGDDLHNNIKNNIDQINNTIITNKNINHNNISENIDNNYLPTEITKLTLINFKFEQSKIL